MGTNRTVTDERPLGTTRPSRIHEAYTEVATILEAVDLAAEPELADEIIAALAALDRAYSIADEDGNVVD
jgi:hypothetical protein